MDLWKLICHGDFPKIVQKELSDAGKEGYEYVFHNSSFVFLKKVIKEGK